MAFAGYLKKHIYGVITSVLIIIVGIYTYLAYTDLKDTRIDRNTSFLGTEIGGSTYESFSADFDMRTLDDMTVQLGESSTSFKVPFSLNQKIKNNLWDNIIDHQNARGIMDRLVHRLFHQKTYISLENLESFDFSSFSHEDLTGLYDVFNIQQVQEGELSFNGQEIIKKYAAPGQRSFLDVFEKNIILLYFSDEAAPIMLTIKNSDPKYSEGDIDTLAVELETILNTERTIVSAKDSSIHSIISPENIQEFVVASYNFGREKFVFGFDEQLLENIRQDLLPRDASWYIDEDYYVAIEPERAGFVISNDQLRITLQDSFAAHKPIITLQSGVYTEAAKKTTDIDGYGLKHVVSEFTTYHGCCASRVENIHLIADMLDGYVLQPGEVLNVNEIIGERTLEKGFKPAGSILKGELIDSVGGGISQFITTLHNAVYWGGYEIVTHKPHSIYFSRYPKGVEATINWPYVDYIFRNDTDSLVMVDTEYTDTSITVRLLGDNADRVFIGDHRGQTWKNVVRTSDEARKVISYVSVPYNYREPFVVYVSDKKVSRGEQVIKQTGKKGWSVMVDRKVIQNGDILHQIKKPVHYFSDKETIIHVNPCDNPSTFNTACYSQ